MSINIMVIIAMMVIGRYDYDHHCDGQGDDDQSDHLVNNVMNIWWSKL